MKYETVLQGLDENRAYSCIGISGLGIGFILHRLVTVLSHGLLVYG